MRRWRAAAALAIGASAACSLAYRPSEYFDPSDQLTVIGTATGSATTIVLTSSLVVYATSTGIFSIPKSGGDPQMLTAFAADDLAALASNGTDLVAWCGAMGVQTWRPGGAVTTIDTAADCDSIDALEENVAAALTSAQAGDGAAFGVSVYRGPSFALDPDGGTPLPVQQERASGDRVALTHDGVYYASGEVVGRRPQPDDVLAKGDPFCGLGLGGGTVKDFRAVDLSGDGGVLTLYRATLGFRFSMQDRCCRVTPDGGGIDACPKASLDFNTAYHAIVIHEPYVYYLPDNELRRAPIGASDDASTLVRGGLNEVLGSLAVDDGFAYLGVGNQILRVAISN